jgi:hypothetical protein
MKLDLAVIASVQGAAVKARKVPRFDPPELYVPAGSLVTITFANDTSGIEPAVAHSFVLVQPGSLEMNPKGLPPASILAKSEDVPPGKTLEFRFMAPPSGNYEFLSTGPEHDGQARQDGGRAPLLRGKFIVQ